VNVVSLIGNLATDVELKQLREGRSVASFVVAIDRPGRDGADFIRIAAWNKQAEACASGLAKGRRVALDGRLRSRTWADSEGNRRSSIEVVANHVEFLSGANESDRPRIKEVATA
jgi:single-strand DNA-binding protein